MTIETTTRSKKSQRKADRKEAIKNYLRDHRGWNTARYHESNYQRLTRILCHLMRPNPLRDNYGNIVSVVTIRAYWMKWNRKELRHMLNAARNNRMNWQRETTKHNGLDLIERADLKQSELMNLQVSVNIIDYINN